MPELLPAHVALLQLSAGTNTSLLLQVISCIFRIQKNNPSILITSRNWGSFPL